LTKIFNQRVTLVPYVKHLTLHEKAWSLGLDLKKIFFA